MTVAVFVVVTTACNGSTGSDGVAADAAADAGACTELPPEASTFEPSVGRGCVPDAGGIYQNGQNLCHAGEYSLRCEFASPPAALSCRSLLTPGTQSLCCPCRP